MGNNKYGPLTALKHLKQGTDSWNGVVTLTSEDNVSRQNGSGGNYTINYDGYKARMISGQEIADIVGNQEWTPVVGSDIVGLPTWLYSNMAISFDYENYNIDVKDIYEHGAYWTDSAFSNNPYYAWTVQYRASMSGSFVSTLKTFGVRPVVRILKSNL